MGEFQVTAANILSCLEVMLLVISVLIHYKLNLNMGAQWLSGRVLDSRPRSREFEPHRCHCVLE